MNKTTKTTVTKETKEYIELHFDDIVEFLDTKGILSKNQEAPQSLKIFVDVPGGGDWSNTELCIQDAPLVIEITNTTETVKNTKGDL